MANESLKYRISLEDYFSKGIRDAEGNAVQFERSVDSIGDHVSRLKNQFVGLFAGYKIMQYGGDIIDTTTKFETLDNVINYTSGSAKEAAANHEFLNRIIKSYKLPVLETTEGFSQFSASVMGSALQGEKARQVYEGVSVAATAMHLSAEQSSSVFLALNQMMSKGKVQAQELTLQLGQALPGAMRLASQSMGMTTAEFMKEMEKGNIASADFLPKFAAELQKTFGAAIPTSVQSLQSQRNEMANTYVDLAKYIGETFHNEIVSGIQLARDFALTLMDVAHWVKENITLVKSAAVGLVSMYVAYKSLTVAASIYNGFLIAEKAATEGLTFAQYALNGAMMLSPIGLLAAGIGAAAAAMYSYTDSIKDYKAAMDSANLSESQTKDAINAELVYLKEKTAELQKQKNLTEDQALSYVVKETKGKLLSDFNDAQKKYNAATFLDENNPEVANQKRRMNIIAAQLKKLDDSNLLGDVKTVAGAVKGGAPATLGSNVSEPAASKIQNITFNLNQPFQNQKIVMGGGSMNPKDLAPQLTEWLISLVQDASIVATE